MTVRCARKILMATGFMWLTASAYAFAGETSHTLGVGLGVGRDYEGSADSNVIPLVYYKMKKEGGRSVELTGQRGSGSAAVVRINLIKKDKWQVGPLIAYRGARDDVDNGAVDALRDVDAALEAGAFVGFKKGLWSGSVSSLFDISDEHDGSVVNLTGRYLLPFSKKLMLHIVASATWADSNYMDTYFSIDTDNSARSGLRTFAASSGAKDVGLGVILIYKLSSEWSVTGALAFARLLEDAADSPIVDDVGDEDQRFFAVLGIRKF